MHSFSDHEYAQRAEKIRTDLKIYGDSFAAIIFGRPELFYYSSLGLDGILFYSNGEIVHYVQRNLSLAKDESKFTVKLMSNFSLFTSLGKNFNGTKLGLELDILPYKTVQYILKAFGNPELVDISGILRGIRAVKSTEEVKIMEKSCKQTDDSFDYIRDKIQPGMTELEVSAKIEKYLRVNGHPGWVQVRKFQHDLSNLALVISGTSIASLNSLFGPVTGIGTTRMHMNGASFRKITDKDPVLIDTTGEYDGYISDVTRTIMMPHVSSRLLEAYEVAKTVHHLAGKLFKPGILASDVFQQLNQLVQESGFGDYFMGYKSDRVSFIGHGVGLELDELPIITPKYQVPLQVGNIIALEPKFILENMGVGIEDTWLVTESGGRKLSQNVW